MKQLFRFAITLAVLLSTAGTLCYATSDYKTSPEYISLRNAMHRAFNDGDSAAFFNSVHQLEDYLLKQDDLHAYYTQRCNEIVFQLNRQAIFEAYMQAVNLSRELTERKLDKEMYMAINMMGHIYHFSGNNASAKRCFWEVIRMMEKEGYIESLPPIYMNLVNIVIDEDPDEALRLIDQAASVARESSPEREFDIETRRTLAYYRMGDMERFNKGYKAYKEGEEKGYSSVHGRTVEVYHLAQEGRIDEAVKMANEQIDDRFSIMAELYASAGRWEEAFRVQKKDMEESDSINSLLLSSSLQGVQTELKRYEDESNEARRHLYTVLAIAILLLMLVVALVYIVEIRRRHLREMRKAYERALESDKMKTAFIQNVSHEVRTPLNVISGFAQVLANPETKLSPEKHRYMADQMIHNANRITLMLNEVLAMSLQESSAEQDLVTIRCNQFMRNLVLGFHLDAEKSRNLTLCFDSSLTEDFLVKSHESILRLIISQLLDNAVKNTEKGSVTLKASTTDTELVVAVEDTGRGVASKDAERIFERFVKLDDFQEGLGIGLTSSRTMARRIGGDVVIDQTYPGPGSRFVLTVPLIEVPTHTL